MVLTPFYFQATNYLYKQDDRGRMVSCLFVTDVSCLFITDVSCGFITGVSCGFITEVSYGLSMLITCLLVNLPTRQLLLIIIDVKLWFYRYK